MFGAVDDGGQGKDELRACEGRAGEIPSAAGVLDPVAFGFPDAAVLRAGGWRRVIAGLALRITCCACLWTMLIPAGKGWEGRGMVLRTFQQPVAVV